MSKQDYYGILGVSKSATPDDIKKAFRQLAKKYHPDQNKDNPSAEDKFKEINEAYEVLKDPQKKAMYDQHGHSAFGQGGGGPSGGFGGNPEDFGDFADSFNSFFEEMMGGRRSSRQPNFNEINRGSDLRYDISITLEDAYKGAKHQIKFKTQVTCDSCAGKGSKSGKATKCSTCGGKGKVRMQQGFFIMEQTCHVCEGSGEMIADPCHKCHGKGTVLQQRTLNINIPAGVEDGSRIRIAKEGEAGRRGAPSGDLYVFVTVKPHLLFQRQGSALYCSLPLKMTTAILGGKVEIPVIDGSKAMLSIPEGTQNAAQFRLRGKGMSVHNSSSIGDMIVQVKVEMPVNLSKKQKELLKQFDEESSENCNPESQSFFGKVKSFFDDLKE
jgi:molecular chaperone DnaJ